MKQILFVHPNFPAQFGPALERLRRMKDVECLFVSRTRAGEMDGVRHIPLKLKGGATRRTHYCARTFENAVWHSHAVYEACKAESGLHPDLIVGHSGFGTTAMLRELYDAPIVNLFEYYYHPHGSDMDYRPDFPPEEIDFLRSRMRNAMILIDLETCDAGYTPTRWQRGLFPERYRGGLQVIHDGIDTKLWRRRQVERRLGEEAISPGTKIVTYVSRGFESMRGFDIFIKTAKRVYEKMDDVIFVCVGSDRVSYGNDLRHIEEKSLRAHLFRGGQYDESRFRFPGRLAPDRLADLLSISDLHIYLTVPFVLSWSVLNAMSCECLVLASDTPPVREFVREGETGILAGFFDVESLSERALDALRDPGRYGHLGRQARAHVETTCGVDASFGKLWTLLQSQMDTSG